MTTIKGQPITITQETDYPFREIIVFKIKTTNSVKFGLHLRIPAWCSSAKILINGNQFQGKAEAGTFGVISGLFNNGDVIQLTLPMEVRTEGWFEGQSVVILIGPLVFSLKIEQKQVELIKDSPTDQKGASGPLYPRFSCARVLSPERMAVRNRPLPQVQSGSN